MISGWKIGGFAALSALTPIGKSINYVTCNAHQIEQIILNLLSNSRYALNKKYPTPNDNKKIELSARLVEIKNRPYVRIEILDFGAGIPRDVLPKIFTPFYTNKEAGEGTGLGLSICEDIVRLHNGNIEFESTCGEYTRAVIDLPIEEPPT